MDKPHTPGSESERRHASSDRYDESNRLMKQIKFKMEGVSTLPELLSKNDYAISFNLKDAYNHVPVHPSMRPLLGLAWRGKCYTFVGMLFGLNDTPRVFTMIMRVAVRII
jgi:hypothetical protein